jgi:hypothetical protein
MAFCSLRGRGVHHGTLPTSSTLPHLTSHPGVASALVTKSDLVRVLRDGNDPEKPWPTEQQLLAQRGGGGAVKEAFTITFGDRAENETGMQMIGTSAEAGVSVGFLRSLEASLVEEGASCEMHDLSRLLEGVTTEAVPEAAVLVIRNGVNKLMKHDGSQAAVLTEVKSMPTDKQSFAYGRVVNKHARYNNTMSDFDQEPDIANRKGTVVNFADYPSTGALRSRLTSLVQAPTPLVGELNHYYDASTCGIGAHGDAERRIVVGVRLGEGADGMPLKYSWYKNSRPVGPCLRIDLNAGDVYIMSEKAVGTDFKRSSILTLRHAAGKDTCKYSVFKGETEAEAVATCPICQETVNTPATGNVCAHAACLACLHEWVVLRKNRSCPTCRAPINALKLLETGVTLPVQVVETEEESEEESEAGEAGAVEAAGGGAVASSGPTLEFFSSWLLVDERDHMLSFVYDCPYQLYQTADPRHDPRHDPRSTADPWCYSSPTAEYYIADENGRRPVHDWGQTAAFYHAGQPMPPTLVELADRLNDQFGLTGVNRLNSCLVTCADNPWVHGVSAHVERHRTSRFFTISLGAVDTRFSMVFGTDDWCERVVLEGGSLIAVDGTDGEGLRLLIPNPTQAPNDPYFSITFRAITEDPQGLQQGEHFAEVDQAAAARVQAGGDLWRPYVLRMFRDEEAANSAVEEEGEAVESGAVEAAAAVEAEAAGEEGEAAAGALPEVSGLASLGDVDEAIAAANTAAAPQQQPSIYSRLHSSRIETTLLLDSVLEAIRSSPPGEPIDRVDMSTATEPFSNALLAKARRVLEVDPLPPDLIFTIVTTSSEWLSALDVPSNKTTRLARNVCMLNRLTAHRARDTDSEVVCSPLEVSWREGSARRHLNLWVFDPAGLALRAQIAGEMDGAQVSAMQHCRGCGRLSITLCGCDEATAPLPPLPDAE